MMWNRLKYHPEELAAEIKGYNITDLRHLRALFEQDLENAGGMPDFRKRRPNKARHPDNLLPAMRVIDERIAVLTRRNGHETEVAVDQYRGGAQEPERPGV